MSLPGGYSAGVRGGFRSGFTIVSTLPLRTPRIVRRWPSTATTRYFSSKIAPLAAFIGYLDADSPNGVSRFFDREIDCGSKTIIHRAICFRKSAASPSTIVVPSMNSARIAELLGPFLRAPIAAHEARHCELAKTGEGSALLSPAQLQRIST